MPLTGFGPIERELFREKREIVSVRRLVQLVLFLMAGFWFAAAALVNPLSFAAIAPAFVVLVIAALASNLPYQYGSSMPMPAPWMILIFLPPALVIFLSSFVFVGTSSTVWAGPCVLEEACETSLDEGFLLRIPFYNHPAAIPSRVEVGPREVRYLVNGEEYSAEVTGVFSVDQSRDSAVHLAAIYGNPREALEVRAEELIRRHIEERGKSKAVFSGPHEADRKFRESLWAAGLKWSGSVSARYSGPKVVMIAYGS